MHDHGKALAIFRHNIFSPTKLTTLHFGQKWVWHLNQGLDLDLQLSLRSRSMGHKLDLDLQLSLRSRSMGCKLDLDLRPSLRSDLNLIHVFVSRSNANIFVIGWQQHLCKKQKYLFLVYTVLVEYSTVAGKGLKQESNFKKVEIDSNLCETSFLLTAYVVREKVMF